jgi:hypothetical protein
LNSAMTIRTSEAITMAAILPRWNGSMYIRYVNNGLKSAKAVLSSFARKCTTCFRQ